MKSKRTDPKKTLEESEKKIKIIKRDFESIIDEHDMYAFDSKEEVSGWFNSFSIENLFDYDAVKNKRPLGKRSMKDFDTKSRLKRMHYDKAEELESALCELNIAHIDCLILKIGGLIDG